MRTGQEYTYDACGNVLTVRDADGTIRRTYDALNRVTRCVRPNGTEEIYCNTTLCIHGNGLISEIHGEATLYHHYNHLGSTMKLTDASGNLVASYTYGAYGELLGGNTPLTRFLYNGQCGVTTDDNGLYYMRQRYYNPEIKRLPQGHQPIYQR